MKKTLNSETEKMYCVNTFAVLNFSLYWHWIRINEGVIQIVFKILIDNQSFFSRFAAICHIPFDFFWFWHNAEECLLLKLSKVRQKYSHLYFFCALVFIYGVLDTWRLIPYHYLWRNLVTVFPLISVAPQNASLIRNLNTI